ncbi:MAG: tRNA (guanosine(46)-N7)-methyltransferase TrmB [Alphaproteobacteria bacterium]|nr:tRNA (guanosine(46)-N7)-methyltransferase TrmB [Alphaproteobacteria bacterium]
MAPEFRRFHGRRLARPLTQRRKELFEHLLPRLRIPLPEMGTLDPRVPFETPPADVWLEIGFGGGEHLAWQAERRPDIGFIGCEPFLNGLATLLTTIEERRLANIRLHPDDARLLLGRLAPRSIGRCFILFPDPWPKARHKKRRIVSAETLDWLAQAMADGAELRLASDDADYVRHMLDVTGAHPAFLPVRVGEEESARRPADWPPTRYEEKALAKGAASRFLIFARRPRG